MDLSELVRDGYVGFRKESKIPTKHALCDGCTVDCPLDVFTPFEVVRNLEAEIGVIVYVHDKPYLGITTTLTSLIDLIMP